MINCPICNGTLSRSKIHDIEVDICAAHGIWLDRSELLSISERERQKPSVPWADFFRREQRPPVDRERHLDCPHCGNEMRIEWYKATFIDWCTDHGVWLDNGELDAILNNLRLDPLYVGKAALRLWEHKY